MNSTKQRDLWKAKSHTTISWAFFAPINTSLKISSNSNLLKQLKYVISYHVAPIGRLKKGIITYKLANGSTMEAS